MSRAITSEEEDWTGMELVGKAMVETHGILYENENRMVRTFQIEMVWRACRKQWLCNPNSNVLQNTFLEANSFADQVKQTADARIDSKLGKKKGGRKRRAYLTPRW